MKISVAMASYNGEKYIRAQLDSILCQSIPVDEIIISDDGSSDSTTEIISSYNDSRIRLITGNPRSGYCGNFEFAIKHTSGDIIFLCDQDDVWMPDKVRQTLNVFDQHPDVELVVTNGSLIDKQGIPIENDGSDINYHFTPHLSSQCSGKLPRSSFLSSSVFQTLANGMRLCFKRTLMLSILPFPDSKIMHDRWICFCALNHDAVYYLDEKLIQYRIHDTNTSMSNNASLKKRWAKFLAGPCETPFDMYNIACSMLGSLDVSTPQSHDAISAATKLRNENLEQIQILSKNRFSGSFALIKRYIKNNQYRCNGPKYFLGQLFLVSLGRRYLKKHRRTIQ